MQAETAQQVKPTIRKTNHLGMTIPCSAGCRSFLRPRFDLHPACFPLERMPEQADQRDDYHDTDHTDHNANHVYLFHWSSPVSFFHDRSSLHYLVDNSNQPSCRKELNADARFVSEEWAKLPTCPLLPSPRRRRMNSCPHVGCSLAMAARNIAATDYSWTGSPSTSSLLAETTASSTLRRWCRRCAVHRGFPGPREVILPKPKMPLPLRRANGSAGVG